MAERIGKILNRESSKIYKFLCNCTAYRDVLCLRVINLVFSEVNDKLVQKYSVSDDERNCARQ